MKSRIASLISASIICLACSKAWAGQTLNDSGFMLPPFLNNEVRTQVLSGAMDGATQGETITHYDTFGANSNGTVSCSKSGGGAQFTGSISGSVLTVSAMGPGSLPIATSQVVMAIGAPTGLTISSFGTGTGGVGTYNLSGSGGTVASEPMMSNDTPLWPTPTKANQVICAFVGQGWHTAGPLGSNRTFQTAMMQINSGSTDWTPTSWPAAIIWSTTPTGSTTMTERMELDEWGRLTMFQRGIGSTATDGIQLLNDTAAVSGTPQQSPSMRWSGQVYATGAGTSQQVDWLATLAPIEGTSATSSLVFAYKNNLGSLTRAASMTQYGLDAAGGYTVGGAAPAGQVLTGDGTKGVYAPCPACSSTSAATFTPNPQCGTGTLSTVEARTKQIMAHLTWFTAKITISSLGTCSGNNITFSLPNTAASGWAGGGEEVGTTGFGIQCKISGSGSTAMSCQKYDSSLNWAAGNTIQISGTYENQ